MNSRLENQDGKEAKREEQPENAYLLKKIHIEMNEMIGSYLTEIKDKVAFSESCFSMHKLFSRS